MRKRIRKAIFRRHSEAGEEIAKVIRPETPRAPRVSVATTKEARDGNSSGRP